MSAFKIGVVSVAPSPYQRDFFRALAPRPEIDLKVYYLVPSTPEYPPPDGPLESYEAVIPGRWFSIANAGFHVVTRFPDLRDCRFVILNSLTSTLAQWLLRFRSPHNQLLFWAERLKPQTSFLRNTIQKRLSAPIRNADAIIAIGSVAESSYRRAFPHLPHFNIPYHCDLQPFLDRPASFPSSTDEIVFLFCGQIIARKGIDLLVAAFDRIIAKGLRARLVLVGRRADLDWAFRFSTRKSRSLIQYVGFLDPKRLPEFFSQAHVFVLPSRYDGWGVVVNQALGAGLPIVCSHAVGAAHDLVSDGVNGFRIAAGSVDDLANAMEAFLRNPQLVVDYGSASRRIAPDWTPTRGAEKWISALEQLDGRQ